MKRMITKIIETTCSVTPEGVPNRTKDILDFFYEVEEKDALLRSVEDDPKQVYFLSYMNDAFYISHTEISVVKSDKTYSDEKHTVWKCEEPYEFVQQLIELGVYTKERMIHEIKDFVAYE